MRCFNILCGNTEDRARNHAAFEDGKAQTLTPTIYARKIASATEASQVMLAAGNNNLGQLKTCLDAAHNFLLSKLEAVMINQCGRLIANVVIACNSIMLTRLLDKYKAAENQKVIAQLQKIPQVAW